MLPQLILTLTLLTPSAEPPAQPMGVDDARHLLARTGFGADLASLQELAGLSRKGAVKKLLEGISTTGSTALPEWTSEPIRTQRRGMSEEERREFRKLRNQRGADVKAWWLGEMVATDSPLTERLTLFWHNHFTTSIRKVRSPRLVLWQNQLLRKHAAGNFRTFLHEVSQDPAMILYLDTQQNNKRKPNENYAREVMELFTLGEGNYTEEDIKEAARAFTGWKINRRTGKFQRNRRQHDNGEKTFFGKIGNFDGHDILDIILEKPRVAVHLTEKLWREFISETPDATEVQRLAGIFRDADYELKPLLSALFNSPHFWDPANRARLVKSPVELVVEVVRVFDLTVGNPRSLAQVTRALGQDVCAPPNVKGWPGGTTWISSSTMLLREQVLSTLASGEGMSMDPSMRRAARRMRRASDRMGMGGRGKELSTWYESLADTDEERQRLVKLILLPRKALTEPGEDIAGASIVRHLVLDPTYQLK